MFGLVAMLSTMFFLSAGTAQIWYAIPLVVVISLVWGATRHESLKEITIQAVRSLLWVLAFMGLIFAVIFTVGYFQ